MRKNSRQPSKLQPDYRHLEVEEPDPRQLSLLPKPVIEQPRCSSELPWGKYLTKEAHPETELQKDKGPKLGKVIKLPAKQPEDPILRLEQNLGCELPVCVSNRRQVNDIAIEVNVDGLTTWKLVRAANSFLPAPEHYMLWLWFLDRCQAAARTGCKVPPRIAIDPKELHTLLGGKLDGRWYENIHKAFSRFANLIVQVHRASHAPTKSRGVDATLGTLCYFVSRRSEGVEPEDLEDFDWGWAAPGQMLWESILAGYVKAVPMQTMLRLPSSAYVAQRLTTYLMKHCQPGETFKISLTKLLPKIPLNCPSKEVKRQLRDHHEALVTTGFLAAMPVFEGRGESRMVTYHRTHLGTC